jgi:hypothetical protein
MISARDIGGSPVDLTGTGVLHLVQEFRSGVGSAIAHYTRSLPEVEHHPLSGTPGDTEGDLAEQADFRSTSQMTGSHRAKVRSIREAVCEIRPDVRRTTQRLVYTAHCFALSSRSSVGPSS